MDEKNITTKILVKSYNELKDVEKQLVDLAKEATQDSYSPYSHFQVGAAILLENGVMIKGCNQENAAFPAGICAERSAIFAAGALYPDVAPTTLAIAARQPNGELTAEPVSPCGTCLQVIIETETRFSKPLRILLYGKNKVYVMDGIKHLMPLSFTEF